MSSQLGELETEPGRFVAKEDFAANEEIMKNGFQSHDSKYVWMGSFYLGLGWIFGKGSRAVSSGAEAGIRLCMCLKETVYTYCYVNEAEAPPWVEILVL